MAVEVEVDALHVAAVQNTVDIVFKVLNEADIRDSGLRHNFIGFRSAARPALFHEIRREDIDGFLHIAADFCGDQHEPRKFDAR